MEVSVPAEVGGILGNKGLTDDKARKLLDQAIAAASPAPHQSRSQRHGMRRPRATYRSDWATVETGDVVEALAAIKRGREAPEDADQRQATLLHLLQG